MSWPFCYEIADGWDSMEGSVSGNGCRPTVGAMMISEALAVATVANATGNASKFGFEPPTLETFDAWSENNDNWAKWEEFISSPKLDLWVEGKL